MFSFHMMYGHDSPTIAHYRKSVTSVHDLDELLMEQD